MKNTIKNTLYVMAIILSLGAFNSVKASVLLDSEISGGDWYLVENGSHVSCYSSLTSGVSSYAVYKNSTFEAGITSFICVSPPWLTATNLNNLISSYSLVAGDIITYEFYTGSSQSGTNIGHVSIQYTGTSFVLPNDLIDTSTRIIDFTPENGTTTPSGVPVDFSLHGYVNPEDIGTWVGIKFTLHNIDQNVLLASSLSPNDIYFLDGFNAMTSGDFYYASSTILADGNYRVNAILERSYLGGFIVNPFSLQDLSHQFVVGSSTFIGNISQNSFSQIQGIYASSTATSTSALAGTCNPLGNFDFSSCLAYMFIPDAGYLASSIGDFKSKVSTHFPLGYVTDFINILNSTTTSSLTVIDAQMPSALGLGTASIHLSLNHVLDPILNATSTVFNNSSASSTQTFYEITSYYWKIIIYLLAGLYIIRRIIGVNIIPHPFQEMSGDKNVSDESYRLKEKLWEMSQRK